MIWFVCIQYNAYDVGLKSWKFYCEGYENNAADYVLMIYTYTHVYKR